MIEAYYQAGKKMSDIATALKRARQTITNVITFLKDGHSAYDYYERYKANKKRCGRKQTQISYTTTNQRIKTKLKGFSPVQAITKSFQ